MPSRIPRDKSLQRLHPRRADRPKLLAGLGGIALVGLDYHFGQLTLFGGITLKMVFFGGVAAVVAHRAGDLPIAWLGSMVTPA